MFIYTGKSGKFFFGKTPCWYYNHLPSYNGIVHNPALWIVSAHVGCVQNRPSLGWIWPNPVHSYDGWNNWYAGTHKARPRTKTRNPLRGTVRSLGKWNPRFPHYEQTLSPSNGLFIFYNINIKTIDTYLYNTYGKPNFC